MKTLLGVLTVIVLSVGVTGCGGRAAEAEPTRALMPTFTPTPDVQPTPTMTPRSLYLGLAKAGIEELQAGMIELGKLAGDIAPDDADWLAAAKSAIRQVIYGYELIQVAKPTADLEAMHVQLLDAAKTCDMAARMFGSVAENFDATLAAAALGMLQDCGTKFAAIEVPITQ